MPNPCRVTKVPTEWGTYEVSTNPAGSTVAFGPYGEQVDMDYVDHSAGVWYMMSEFDGRMFENTSNKYHMVYPSERN